MALAKRPTTGEIEAKVTVIVVDVVGKLMKQVADRARVNLSGKMLQRRSGVLYNSVADRVLNLGTIVRGEVYSHVPYGYMQEVGTRPHVILPRKSGGYLRFEVGGRVVFAKKVNHPGTKPTPWLHEAFDTLKPSFQPAINTALHFGLDARH